MYITLFMLTRLFLDHVDHRCVVTMYDETVVLKLFPKHTMIAKIGYVSNA